MRRLRPHRSVVLRRHHRPVQRQAVRLHAHPVDVRIALLHLVPQLQPVRVPTPPTHHRPPRLRAHRQVHRRQTARHVHRDAWREVHLHTHDLAPVVRAVPSVSPHEQDPAHRRHLGFSSDVRHPPDQRQQERDGETCPRSAARTPSRVCPSTLLTARQQRFRLHQLLRLHQLPEFAIGFNSLTQQDGGAGRNEIERANNVSNLDELACRCHRAKQPAGHSAIGRYYRAASRAMPANTSVAPAARTLPNRSPSSNQPASAPKTTPDSRTAPA